MVQRAGEVGAAVGQGKAFALPKFALPRPQPRHSSGMLALDLDEVQRIDFAWLLEEHA